MPSTTDNAVVKGINRLQTKPLWFCLLYFGKFEVLTSLKIISGDMRGRNGLKSKVSTLEELYDFFSENTQKLHQYDVIFGAVDILSTGSLLINLFHLCKGRHKTFKSDTFKLNFKNTVISARSGFQNFSAAECSVFNGITGFEFRIVG